MLVAIQAVSHFLELPTLIFYPDSERSVCALSFNPQRQISLEVRATIRRVMILIVLFVTEHVDAIEIRLVEFVRLLRRTPLQNHPTARSRFLRYVFGPGRR